MTLLNDGFWCVVASTHILRMVVVYAANFSPPLRNRRPECVSLLHLPSVPTPEDIHSTFSASKLIQLADVIIIIPAFHAISRLSCYSNQILSAVTLIIYSFNDYMCYMLILLSCIVYTFLTYPEDTDTVRICKVIVSFYVILCDMIIF